MNLDLDKLEQVARAATPGPWETGGIAITADNDTMTVAVTHFPGMLGSVPKAFRPRNADFIAAANPTVVLELVRRLRAAEAATCMVMMAPNVYAARNSVVTVSGMEGSETVTVTIPPDHALLVVPTSWLTKYADIARAAQGGNHG